jgi:hypothetical protein
MTQMLRQCVSPDQRDWVAKLPAIEFAMNSATSETTGFSAFFLNYGQVPRSLLWNREDKYPGVKKFAAKIKGAIMLAHDAIIAACVKQTRQANKHRRQVPFKENDLVYLSTKNLSLPKGRSRKLCPKFIGPFKILKEIEPGAAYILDLPKELKKRGVNASFHASLLKIYVPSDDTRFPGRKIHQLPGFGVDPSQWEVEQILSHNGKGSETLFQVQWKSGHTNWVPLRDVEHLIVFSDYLEAMGVRRVSDLPALRQEVGAMVAKCSAMRDTTHALISCKNPIKDRYDVKLKDRKLPTTKSSCSFYMPSGTYSAQDVIEFSRYNERTVRFGADAGPHPGPIPAGYIDYYKATKNPLARIPDDYPKAAGWSTSTKPTATHTNSVNMDGGSFSELLGVVKSMINSKIDHNRSVGPSRATDIPHRHNRLADRVRSRQVPKKDWIPRNEWFKLTSKERRNILARRNNPTPATTTAAHVGDLINPDFPDVEPVQGATPPATDEDMADLLNDFPHDF